MGERGAGLKALQLAAILVLAALAGNHLWKIRPLKHGPGEIARNPPRQVLVREAQPLQWSDGRITPLASFQARVRVLAIKRYRGTKRAALAPYDFVLGWGPMSDEALLDHLKIKQRSRSYRFEYSNLPVAEHVLRRNSANVHMAPANEGVLEVLEEVRRGHVIELSGYLVAASDERGTWRSSLSRSDDGPNSTELLWVERLRISP